MSKIQVLLVPEDRGSIKSFRVPRNYLHVCLALLVGGAVLCLGSAVAYYEFWKSHQELAVVEDENESLRAHLDETSDRIRVVAELVEEGESLEQEARLLAGLEPLDAETRRLGVGGPLLSEGELPWFDDSELAEEAVDQSRVLDELERRVEFQRDSYRETLSILRDRKDQLDRTPTISPLRDLHMVSSNFGWRRDPFTDERAFHRGLDLRGSHGAPVYATAAGRVVFVGSRGAFGRTVEIDHGEGVHTKYAHLAEIQVEKGEEIRRGHIVGTVGSSGRSTGPHVHYEVLVEGVARDPETYILSPEVIVD